MTRSKLRVSRNNQYCQYVGLIRETAFYRNYKNAVYFILYERISKHVLITPHVISIMFQCCCVFGRQQFCKFGLLAVFPFRGCTVYRHFFQT